MRQNSGMSRIDWGLVGIIEDPRANIKLKFNTCFYASLSFTKSAIVYVLIKEAAFLGGDF